MWGGEILRGSDIYELAYFQLPEKLGLKNGIFILDWLKSFPFPCFDKLGPSWVQLNLGCDWTKECGYFVILWN